MEKAFEILLQQSTLVIFMGVIIYIMYRREEKRDKRIEELSKYILDREREYAQERMDEQKETIEALNEVATALSEHNKITEYEQRRKKT